MKIKPVCFCLTVLVQFVISMASLEAASIKFNPDYSLKEGMLTGRVFVERLGQVKLPHGRALFRGNSVDIAVVPEFQFDRVIVLTGALLKTEAEAKGQEINLAGTIYFFDGDWLKYIDDPTVADLIVTQSGTIKGRLKGITKTALEMEEENGMRREVPLNELLSLRSPRAFDFNLPCTAHGSPILGKSAPFTADATSLHLTPSTSVFQLKALRRDRLMAGDGDLSASKLILLGAAYSTAQLAQMLPFLLVPLNSGHYIRNANARLNRFFMQSNFQQANGLPAPIPPPGAPQHSPGG